MYILIFKNGADDEALEPATAEPSIVFLTLEDLIFEEDFDV